MQRLIEMLENGLMLRGAYDPPPFTDAIRVENKAIAAELRALLAERDALKAKVPPPVRKLREYKGIVYDPDHFAKDYPWCAFGDGFRSVSHLLWSHGAQEAGLTDADHAAIYALKDDPWERIPSVEDVLLGIAERIRDGYAVEVEDAATRLRAAVAAEGVRDA